MGRILNPIRKLLDRRSPSSPNLKGDYDADTGELNGHTSRKPPRSRSGTFLGRYKAKDSRSPDKHAAFRNRTCFKSGMVVRTGTSQRRGKYSSMHDHYTVVHSLALPDVSLTPQPSTTLIHRNTSNDSSMFASLYEPNCVWTAVYDGFGTMASDAASAYLSDCFLNNVQKAHGHLDEALQKAFIQVDAEMKKMDGFASSRSYTSGLVVVVAHNSLYVCNVGDCVAYYMPCSASSKRSVSGSHLSGVYSRRASQDSRNSWIYIDASAKSPPMSSSRTTRARASSPNLHPQLYQADGPVPTTSTPVPTPSAQVDPSEGSALYPEGPTSAIQSVLAQAHTPTSEDRARRHLVIDTGGAGAPGLSQVQVHDCDCDGKGKGEREHSADVCCQATRGGANKTDKEAKNSITQSLPTITRTSMTPHTADDEGAGGLVFTLRQTSDSAGQSINSTAGDTDKTSTSVKSSPAEASKHTRTDEPFNYSASPNTPQSPSGTPTENSIGLIKQNSSPTPTSTSGQEFKLQPQTGMGRRFSNSNISYFPHSRSNLGIERKELLHSARSQPGSDTPSPGKSPTRAHTHTHTHSTHRQSFTPTRAPGEDASTTTLNAATPTHNDTVAMATSATTGPTDGRQTSQGSANSALSSASHERRDSWGVPQPHRRYSNASLLARQAAAAAAAAASPHNRSMTSLGSTEGVVKLNNAHTASSFVEKQGVVLRGGRVADGKVNGISRTTRALGSANCGPGVACDPETFVQPLEISVPHVVVIATSGLWDFCTISQVRKFLMDHLTFSEDQDLDALAGEVVKLAKGLNKAVEDVTVLLILVLPGRATGGSPRVSGESTTSATNGSLGKGLQQKSSGSLKLGARIARRFSNSSTQSNGNTSSKATASHDQHTARRASIDEGRDEEVPKGTHGGKHAHTSTPPQPPQDVQSTAGQVRRDLGSVSYEGRTSDLSQLTGLGMPLTGMTSSSDTLRAAVSGMKARRASADSTASVGSSGGRMHRYTSYACPLVNATVGSATRAQGQGQTPALNSAAPVQLQQSVSNYIQPVPDAPRSAFKSSMYDDLMKSKAADTNGSHGSHGGLAGGKVSKGVKCGTENGTVVKSASGKKKKIDIIKGREGRGLSEVEEVEDVVYDSPPPPLGCIKGFKMNP